MAETSMEEIMAWLHATADENHRQGLQRYGIPVEPALGVPMGEIKRAARRINASYATVLSLWETGVYEARIMSVHLADPKEFARVDADAWCADFDNWALCDTAAFQLFDRTDYAWEALRDWAQAPGEYVRRAGFAILWGLSVHDKTADDARFLDALDLAEAAAGDHRLYVKKAVDMALRAIGKRNRALNVAICDFAQELAGRDNATARWMGRHVLKELQSDKVRRNLGRL